jgi:hypothetical protein
VVLEWSSFYVDICHVRKHNKMTKRSSNMEMVWCAAEGVVPKWQWKEKLTQCASNPNQKNSCFLVSSTLSKNLSTRIETSLMFPINPCYLFQKNHHSLSHPLNVFILHTLSFQFLLGEFTRNRSKFAQFIVLYVI